MPVWKYRSIDEMPEAWVRNRHIPPGRRIRALMTLRAHAGPLEIPRGIRKFRSLAELQDDRRRYERLRIERFRKN
ncbi:MAG TPA: hypothetical protein VNL91_11870 [Thermoanaerobaculia bacterium]|nr:hypothetical protein [Thermoanaerobaculia bacterium]